MINLEEALRKKISREEPICQVLKNKNNMNINPFTIDTINSAYIKCPKTKVPNLYFAPEQEAYRIRKS